MNDNEEKEVQSGIRVSISIMFLAGVFLIVCTGIIMLEIATSYISTVTWGEFIPPFTFIDYIAIELYPPFFTFRDTAVKFLFGALIIYPIWMWLDQTTLKKPVGNRRFLGLLIGMLLPNVFIYGNPAGPYRYLAPSNFELTGLVTPIYSFLFSGHLYVNAQFTVSGTFNPFATLGLILFGFALLECVGLIYYERGRVGTKLFVIPIILNIIFLYSLLMIGFPSAIASSVLTDYSGSATIAEVCVPVPIFPILILIRGAVRKKNSRS